MSVKPTRAEYLIPARDIYGRRVVLIRETDYQKRSSWIIMTERANQRDEDQFLVGLTADVIRMIAQIVVEVEGQ